MIQKRLGLAGNWTLARTLREGYKHRLQDYTPAFHTALGGNIDSANASLVYKNDFKTTQK